MKNSDRKDHDVLDTAGNKIGETNPDPITGEPGSHPIGTGIGAAGAGAVGAAIGAVAGPIGALAGAAIGSIVGGLAGHGIAEAIDPTAEESFWRDEFKNRPYVKDEHKFEDFAPAYRLGTEARIKHQDRIRSFEDIESDLSQDWDRVRGGSQLAWETAKHASRDAFDRVHDRLTNPTTTSTGSDVSGRGIGATDLSGSSLGSNRDLGVVAGGIGSGAGLGATRDLGTGRTDDFDVDYFRTSFTSRPYYTADARFEDFEPAYRYGYTARNRFTGRNWDDVEIDLGRDWEIHRGTSRLTWDRAKLAVRDAWDRLVHNR